MRFEPTTSPQVGTTPGVASACRFNLEQGPLAGRAFTALLFICQNPCCPCGVVGFDCRDEVAAGATTPSRPLPPPVQFDLDVFKRTLSPRKQSDPEGLALGKAFVAEAKTEPWEWLQKQFMSVKAWHMRTMDLDSLHAEFPPEVLAGDGSMVGYAEVFPWSDAFVFARNDGEWLVADQYCVAPGCKCTETVLVFCQPAAPCEQADEPPRGAPALRFNYVSGKSELIEVQPGGPPVATLMQGLRAAHPDLVDTLRQRHQQLHRLARRLLPKSRSRARRRAADAAELGFEPHHEAAPSPAPAVRAAPKVGRNDPCPCGSGRKYKKCCGRPRSRRVDRGEWKAANTRETVQTQ